jgi:hypothetical protein
METANRRRGRLRVVLTAFGGVVLVAALAAGCGSCGDNKNRNDPNSQAAEGEPQPSSGRHRPFRIRWDGGRHRRHHGEGGALLGDGEGGAPAE